MASKKQAKHRDVQASVHTYQSGLPALVNAYVVETPNGLVCIDATQTVADSLALRRKIELLEKPLLAILLTHGHPDHYAGIGNVLKGTALPIVSTANVAAVAQQDDAKWDQVGRQVLGDQWPANRPFPNTLLESGQTITFDGVTFTVTELGPGESGADTYWQVDALPAVVFSGDVFYNHMHGFLVDGHSGQWLENIKRVEQQWQPEWLLYPGHGGATAPAVLAWQRAYLEMFRQAVQELAQGKQRLSEAEKAQVKQQMIAFTGNRRLEPYLDRSIEAVARELLNKAAK